MDFPLPKDHCLHIMTKIYSMVNKPNLCDLSVIIEGQEFWVHKCVLFAACPTLEELMSSEKRSDFQLTLEGLTVAGFSALLQFIYTGKAPNDQDEDLLSDFKKACHALGVTIRDRNELQEIKLRSFREAAQRIQQRKFETQNIFQPKHEPPVVIEVTTTPCVGLSNGDNEGDNTDEESENLSPSDIIRPELESDHDLEENSSDDDAENISCGNPSGNIDITSLFSVTKRDSTGSPENEDPDTAEPLPKKVKKRGRPPVSNDNIFPTTPPFNCPHLGCPKVCDTREKLKKHYCNHNEKTHLCNLCGRRFLYKKDVVVHLRTHTGEKPFECATCGMCFAQKCTLQNHMATHLAGQAAAFPCSMCDKIYSSYRSRALHMKEKHLRNNDQQDYSCSLCGKKYKHQASFLDHINSGCDGGSYICSKCGQRYKRREPFKNHQAKCNGLTQYKCALCNKLFKSKNTVSSHIKFTHDIYPVRPDDIIEVSSMKPDNKLGESSSVEALDDGNRQEITNLANMIFLEMQEEEAVKLLEK